MWLLKACFLLIFPEPVTLKRFLALDLVFILGMIPNYCGLTYFFAVSFKHYAVSFTSDEKANPFSLRLFFSGANPAVRF
jgi:hypothetical protein